MNDQSLSLARRAKHTIKRSRSVTLAAWIAKNALFGLKARIGRGDSMRIGATHRERELDESLAYIDWVLGDYRRYAGLDADAVAGKRILEPGPGDNYGVALELIGDGAEQVIGLDRFKIWRDADQQRTIYRAQVERASGERRERMSAALLDSGDAFDPDRIQVTEGVAIEDAGDLLGGPVDAIISRAVLAHIWDLDLALDRMDSMLSPGGLIAHKVDLSDHGLLTDGGHNALEFLTVSDPVWDRMRRNTGLTNRRLLNSYRDWLAARGYETELLAARVTGDDFELDPHHWPLTATELERARPRIAEIRSRLLPRYSSLDEADLACSGAFVVARKNSSS